MSPDGKPKKIWVALAHHTWWPSFLVKLDAKGKAVVQFTDSGVMYVLNHVRNASGAYVLAGGINNEYASAKVAVIEVNQTPATSPQTRGSPYKCDNCPQGTPYRYFLFPPSELSPYGLPYNNVILIRVHENGIQVETAEFPEQGFYELTSNFDVATVAMSDGYPQLHRKLEQEGRLKHSFDDCPERKKPKLVRVWTPQVGWIDVQVPWAVPQS